MLEGPGPASSSETCALPMGNSGPDSDIAAYDEKMVVRDEDETSDFQTDWRIP